METTTFKTITRSLALLVSLALLLSLHPGKVLNAQAAPGDTTRISVDSSGAQANGWSRRDAITADGRYVAFMSDASNLVSGDTNGTQDIFVRDRQTGLTTRVSVDSAGIEANAGSDAPAISNNGRYVAFSSYASNLVSGDTNGLIDIFVHDTQTGETTRVSIGTGGVEANGESSEYNVSISGDGRYVTFYSDASNLVNGDTNNAQDVFVHDRQTGVTTRASVASNGAEGNGSSGDPNISGDGRYVTFSSAATNLVAGDTNGKSDVFVRDLQAGETTRVSVNSSGEQADGGGGSPDISADGRYVVFLSDSHNLAPETDDYEALVYVHDRQVGQTTLASVYSEGNIMVGKLDQPTISSDGRYVAYSYYHKGNNDGIMDVWAHDMQMGGSIEVAAGNASSFGPSFSADGSIIAYWSLASGLVSGDTNDAPDIFVSEVSYGPDNDPTVASVTPDCGMYVYRCIFPTPDNISFIVIFSEQVTGVTTDDFSLRMDEGITGASITGVSGYGTEYFVHVNTGTGDGILHLDVLDDDSIKDTTLNPLGGAGAGNGDYTTGHGYWVDKSAPTVTNIVRADPNPTAADTVHFTVDFSEDVGHLKISDLVLTTTGNISGASVTAISPAEDEHIGAATYTVTVSTGTGDGTLRLDLVDDDSIGDWDSPSPLGGTGIGNGDFSSGEVYTIARNAPTVTGILRADPSPTAAASVNFTVIFSEPVNGVDPSDFSMAVTGGLAGTSVTDLTGTGEIYTVTTSTGSGEGTLRLDLLDDDSITDGEGNPLGGQGTGNGAYTAGESYTIDRATPSVFGILRADADPTTAPSVAFTVVFSEAVTGVDTGDFSTTTTGNLTGVTISGLSGSGSSYSVNVSTGSGQGTLRLDLLDNDSISDSSGYPLGGSGAGNGNYTSGETYTISRIPRNIYTSTFRSNGRNDGWVLESSEDSSVGGSFNSSASIIYIGDSNQDAQYRAILHFPTYYLPDNAVITKALVMLKGYGLVGSNPFTSHGNLLIDIRSGAFNNSLFFWYNGLDVFDFQNPASMDAVGVIPNAPISNWYWALLDSRAFAYINLNGVTQLRLRFEIEDDDNMQNDLLILFSGDYGQLADRPRLVVEYYLGR
jgi:hypothetical protein